MTETLDVKLGHVYAKVLVEYRIIPGERAALDNPPTPTDIEITNIVIKSPSWATKFESVIEDKIKDYDLPYIHQLLRIRQ